MGCVLKTTLCWQIPNEILVGKATEVYQPRKNTSFIGSFFVSTALVLVAYGINVASRVIELIELLKDDHRLVQDSVTQVSQLCFTYRLILDAGINVVSLTC